MNGLFADNPPPSSPSTNVIGKVVQNFLDKIKIIMTKKTINGLMGYLQTPMEEGVALHIFRINTC